MTHKSDERKGGKKALSKLSELDLLKILGAGIVSGSLGRTAPEKKADGEAGGSSYGSVRA